MSDATRPALPTDDPLSDQIHPILNDWSQLIVSLASLIRENVEGLLPAVFGLAGLTQSVTEANLGATQMARDAGVSLRKQADSLKRELIPLTEAVRATTEVRNLLANQKNKADQLRTRYSDDPELVAFLDQVSHDSESVVPRVLALIDAASGVEQAGLAALSDLESGLESIDGLLQSDSQELEAAALRVKLFVESSKSTIDQLIVKLQFQDRTDQILQHLLADFESLSQAINAAGEEPFDAAAWRAERQQRFTTSEERKAGSGQVSTDAGDIELF